MFLLHIYIFKRGSEHADNFWVPRILFCTIARFDTLYLTHPSVLVTFDLRLRTAALNDHFVGALADNEVLHNYYQL